MSKLLRKAHIQLYSQQSLLYKHSLVIQTVVLSWSFSWVLKLVDYQNMVKVIGYRFNCLFLVKIPTILTCSAC